MVRNSNVSSSTNENAFDNGLGLGPHLVGKQIDMNGRTLSIHKQLGEGGFSFVYLVREIGGSADDNACLSSGPQHEQRKNKGGKGGIPPKGSPMVLKITSVHTSTQRLMSDKEAKLLRTLSHPSIVRVYDDGFREEAASSDDKNSSSTSNNRSVQHLILMEHCEGGTAFDAIKQMRAASGLGLTSSMQHQQHLASTNSRFDLPSLVIAFGQICNAVSYLHAQRPPVIHRDLKPVNFLIKHNSYKLCDFGSAVLGHTDLRTPENRRKAEEIVGKTTTQMFRAPEMVDLYMSKRLTQSTDVWALGCCLYSLAFLKDCFEEGSNLAILSRKYKIPEDNPYGEGIVDLIDRMLTVDYKERADMSEVIMCLSALYSNRELPKRKRREKVKKEDEVDGKQKGAVEGKSETEIAPRVGAYRTDGQGIRRSDNLSPVSNENKVMEVKKLNPNSAAAKRKKASEINKQKEVVTTPSQMSSSSASGGGKKSIASASTRSETPISDSGDFGNFASFDQAFEDSFDPFLSKNDGVVEFDSSDKASFASVFNDQCQIGSARFQPQNRAAESSFEVTFQGFDSSAPSAFSTNDHYFSNSNGNDGFGDMTGQKLTNQISTPSSKRFFGLGGGINHTSSTSNISTKKKRGVFGMLGKK